MVDCEEAWASLRGVGDGGVDWMLIDPANLAELTGYSRAHGQRHGFAVGAPHEAFRGIRWTAVHDEGLTRQVRLGP